MNRVVKQISFCYGHRLQNYNGKCQHPHGHNAVAEFHLEGDLDSRGMVTDFTDIKNTMKKWIDENFDHQMLLRNDDPLIPWMKEHGEPYFETTVNPTAEYIAQLLFEKARSEGLLVTEVRVWETPTSYASFREV